MNTPKNFNCKIEAKTRAADAYKKISRVQDWWAQNFTGSAANLGDTFTVRFGDTFVDFKISEAEPGKKVAWYVTNCWLPWQNDKTEWNGTTVVFKLNEVDGVTTVDMTHYGLTPDVECYKNCEAGWSEHLKDSLQPLLAGGKGDPQAG